MVRSIAAVTENIAIDKVTVLDGLNLIEYARSDKLQRAGEHARSGFGEGEILVSIYTDSVRASLGSGCDCAVAGLATATEDPERAVRLLGAADVLRERTGIVASTAGMRRIDKALAEAREHLGEAAYMAAWSAGRAMSLPQAAADALGPTGTVLTA